MKSSFLFQSVSLNEDILYNVTAVICIVLLVLSIIYYTL